MLVVALLACIALDGAMFVVHLGVGNHGLAALAVVSGICCGIGVLARVHAAISRLETIPMKDQYTADRHDPKIKRLEREGITALIASRAATVPVQRLVSAVLIAILLSQVPAFAVPHESWRDSVRRWEHGSYCQGLFSHKRWYTDYVAYLSGC